MNSADADTQIFSIKTTGMLTEAIMQQKLYKELKDITGNTLHCCALFILSSGSIGCETATHARSSNKVLVYHLDKQLNHSGIKPCSGTMADRGNGLFFSFCL